MLKLHFILLCLLLYSCKPHRAKYDANSVFCDPKDSLEVVCLMLKDLEKEMFDKNIAVDSDTSTLYTIGCYLEWSNIFSIQENKKGQVMAKGKLVQLKNITDLIVEFYTKNAENNDITNNFPLYTRITKEQIIDNLNYLKKECVEINKQSSRKALDQQQMIEFNEKQIKEWESKLSAINILKLQELPEVHYQTRIEIHNQTLEKNHKFILESIFQALLQLRNQSSQKYFNENLISIYYRNLNTKNPLDSNKLNALRQLHPIEVIDFANLKKYHLFVYPKTSEIPILPKIN